MLSDGHTYGWMNGRKTASLYRAMPEAGATKRGGCFSDLGAYIRILGLILKFGDLAKCGFIIHE